MGARLLRQYGRRPLVAAAVSFELVGLVGLSRLDPDTPYAVIGVFLACLGGAMAIFPAVSLDLALDRAADDRGGLVSGAHTAALQFGQLISIAVMGSLVSAGVGGIYRSDVTAAGLDPNVPDDLIQDLARGESAAPPGSSGADRARYEELGEFAFTTAVGRAVLITLAAVLVACCTLGGARERTPLPLVAGPERLSMTTEGCTAEAQWRVSSPQARDRRDGARARNASVRGRPEQATRQ